jgi:hypothetical protein
MSLTGVKAAKDPVDVKNYSTDWSALLEADGATAIASSVWSVSVPAGLTIHANAPYAPTIVGMKTTIYVSGGTTGASYRVSNTIVTNSVPALTYRKTLIIPCASQ